MKRNPSVELMRIFACLAVVGVHTCLSAVSGDRVDIGRLFISCLLADGVAVFWIIMGFFLFGRSDYRKTVLHAVKGVLIPMAVLSVIIFYLGPWIMDGEALKDSVSHSADEYSGVLRKLLSWSNPVEGMGHLWYLYVYMLVILIFPVLKSFVSYLEESTERQKVFFLISGALLILNDISDNRFGSFSHYSINALFPASIEVIWGHFIYKYRKRFSNWKWIPVSIAAFLGINLIRTFIHLDRYQNSDTNSCVLYWYSFIGVLCALCIIAFCFSSVKQRDSLPNRVICFVASHTFMIYLIHPVIRNILRRYQVEDRLYKMVFNWNASFLAEILYTLLIIVIVFGVSFLVCVFLRIIQKMLRKVYICLVQKRCS